MLTYKDFALPKHLREAIPKDRISRALRQNASSLVAGVKPSNVVIDLDGKVVDPAKRSRHRIRPRARQELAYQALIV
jgi:hypothetical protein